MSSSSVANSLPGSLAIDLGSEALVLLPDRAVYSPARKTVIVADVHLGKGTAFRHAGVPVPSGSSAKDLARLEAIRATTGADRLVILGDLIHARSSHQQELRESIARWRAVHRGLEVLLIRGNHDRSAGRLPAEWDIQEVEEPFEDQSLILSHIPRYGHTKPVLAGHVHPVVARRDFDRSTVRIPCFFIDGRGCMILPAFGSFTGGHVVRAQDNDQCFIASGKSVVRCSAQI